MPFKECPERITLAKPEPGVIKAMLRCIAIAATFMPLPERICAVGRRYILYL